MESKEDILVYSRVKTLQLHLLKDPVYSLLKALAKEAPGKTLTLHIAGSAVATNTVNDIDLFISDDDWHRLCCLDMKGVKYHKTRNAITIQGDKPVQFCHYFKPTLKELVDSFDFAHVQVGARLQFDIISDSEDTLGTKEIYISDAKRTASFIETGFYTGSEYPLSSLIRLNKYVRRELISGRQARLDTLAIITDIVKRGFTSDDDFKDQLDAIDLMNLDENLAFAFKEACKERGLFTNKEAPCL